MKIGSVQGEEHIYIYSPIGEAINIEEDMIHTYADAMHGRGNETAAAFGCGVENLRPLARQVG